MEISYSFRWPLLACAVVAALLTTPAVAKDSGEEADYYNNCEGSKIYDITHRLVEGMPAFDSEKGVGKIVSEIRLKHTYYGTIKLNTHMGTHVDSPGHFYENMYKAGLDVESLDLGTLNGPVLVVDTPRDKNITAEVMETLNIPKGVKRVIFKTLNTERALMNNRTFAPDYTGFTTDGAEWLVNNTDIKLVGIDYLSIATKDEIIPVHQALLQQKDIIPVECLKLDEINPGYYSVHCLPLRLPLADGSPARCILME